jgi:uncharacterized RDD family membrane protein YckC
MMDQMVDQERSAQSADRVQRDPGHSDVMEIPNDRLAEPGRRLVAAFIDGILTAPLALIPILGLLVGLAYHLTKDALPLLNGQSIGKKAMGIRVVRQATGEPITNDYATAIVRQVSLMIPLFGFIDALCVLFESRRRQRFGDRWAETLVVRETT